MRTCIDCGTQIKNYKAKRCKKHGYLYLSKIRRQQRYCKDCGKEISNGHERCFDCSHQGGKNGRFVDGRSMKTVYCLDCNKILSDYRAKRCVFCSTSRIMKIRFKNKDYKNKIVKILLSSQSIKPNKSETILIGLLNNILPNEYKFVGNGKIIIDGFNPDFINVNGQKKIIEHFGDYWHNLPEYKKRDKARLKAYSKYGYSTLIIWQNELNNLKKVKEKILEFN